MADSKFARTPTDLRLHTSLFGLPCHIRRQSMAYNDAQQEEEAVVMAKCPLCGCEVPELMYPLQEATDRMAINGMKAQFPEWEPGEGVCGPCLEQSRLQLPAFAVETGAR